MDGIAAVTARICEIRSSMQLVGPAVATRSTSSPGTAAATGAAFAASTGASTVASTGASTGLFTGSAPATGSSPGSFADVLAQAVARPTAPTTGARHGMSVAELQSTHRNGRVPAEALAPIGHGGHRLAAPAATAFQQMEAAARRDGVRLGVTDSYRSYDAQVDVARRKGLYSQGGLAAQPGTSQHGWGLAVDLDLDARAQAWMRANGARFGFVEDTPREPWHWAFQA